MKMILSNYPLYKLGISHSVPSPSPLMRGQENPDPFISSLWEWFTMFIQLKVALPFQKGRFTYQHRGPLLKRMKTTRQLHIDT